VGEESLYGGDGSVDYLLVFGAQHEEEEHEVVGGLDSSV
jgi:hypothetical protein